MADAEQITAAALELPRDKRTEVAMRLLDSLEAPDPHANIGDDELVIEMQRRADQAEVDPDGGEDWASVRSGIEGKLGL